MNRGECDEEGSESNRWLWKIGTMYHAIEQLPLSQYALSLGRRFRGHVWGSQGPCRLRKRKLEAFQVAAQRIQAQRRTFVARLKAAVEARAATEAMSAAALLRDVVAGGRHLDFPMATRSDGAGWARQEL